MEPFSLLAPTRCSGGAPALRSWLRRDVLAVDGHQPGLVGPALPHPVGERRREQRGVDAVHQDRQPPLARHAMRVGQMLAEKVEMRLAPRAAMSS